MFVKRTVRRRGDKSYEYLSLVEAVREGGRNTHRRLLRLGEVTELRASGQIDRIIRVLRVYAEGTWLEAGESGNGAPSFGAAAAVWSYFCRLGLDEYFSLLGDGRRSKVVSDTVFAMVANRLIDPASRRRTITEWLSSVALPPSVNPPSLDQCYRAVDTVSGAKEATEAHLYRQLRNLTNLDLRLVCYDITSSYFETRRRGEALFLPRLRLQPGPIRPAPDRDRAARHRRRHPHRPSRLFRQHLGRLDPAGRDGGLAGALWNRAHRSCRR